MLRLLQTFLHVHSHYNYVEQMWLKMVIAWCAQWNQEVRQVSQEPFKYETQMECAIKETTSKFKQLKGCNNSAPSRCHSFIHVP